jgi:outer membrane protein TolC
MTPSSQLLLVVLTAILLGVSQRASAQTADPFAPIVAEAVRANLSLAQERAAADRAAAAVDEARARFLPAITLDARRSRQSGVLDLGDAINPAYAALNGVLGQNRFPTDVSIVVPYAYESRARLAQPLFDPAIVFAHQAATAQRDAQLFQERGAGRRIAAAAQRGWLDAAAARRARMVWESTLGLVSESERVAERLLQAGQATPDVVYRARADWADVEQKLAEARDVEGAAARAFNQILRRPLDAPVDEIADSLLFFPIAFSEQQATERALAAREELGGASAGSRAADAVTRLADAPFLPRVAVALDYGFQGREVTFDRAHHYTMASVIVSWDVFNGGRDLARRQEALADAERARLRLEETKDLVALDVRQAYRTALVARDAIATAETRLAAARRSHDLVHRRFQEGLAPQVELLDARNALTGAELNRVITIYRYARSWVELERAAALRPTTRTGQ